jgi:hypothetical protein
MASRTQSSARATRRKCVECGTPFEGQDWQRLCWGCWRAEKDQEAQADAYDQGFRDGLREGSKRSGIDRELLLDTIQLCHPDRHPAERREMATKTTAALLNLRSELAA